MDHFLKSFSVIDFLGIFTLGVLVTLAYTTYLGGVTESFTNYTGNLFCLSVLSGGYFIAEV